MQINKVAAIDLRVRDIRSETTDASIDMLAVEVFSMPKPQPGPNRHHFRIWIKMAIQSGLIEKLPPLYEPIGNQSPFQTEAYARRLLTELRDPEASRRPLKEIIADARQFKTWVESRRKDGLKRISLKADRMTGSSRCRQDWQEKSVVPKKTAPPGTIKSTGF